MTLNRLVPMQAGLFSMCSYDTIVYSHHHIYIRWRYKLCRNCRCHGHRFIIVAYIWKETGPNISHSGIPIREQIVSVYQNIYIMSAQLSKRAIICWDCMELVYHPWIQRVVSTKAFKLAYRSPIHKTTMGYMFHSGCRIAISVSSWTFHAIHIVHP